MSQPVSHSTLISFRGAAVRSGDRSLFVGTDWDIHLGEHWGIVGPNGSGKSLLAAALAGRVPVVQGTLIHRVEGELVPACDLGGGHARRHHVVLLSQGDHTALATLRSGYHQARWNAGEIQSSPRVDELLTRHSVEAINPFEVLPEPADAGAFAQRQREVIEVFRLTPLLHRRVNQLSDGETRKLLLARATLRGPRVLVLDEPFAGLDVQFRAELRGILDSLAGSGVTLVLATTRPDELPACITHVLQVAECQVQGQGPRAKLKPSRPVDRAAGRARAGAALGPAIVELSSVSVRYGDVTILDRVDFTVRQGEHWAVLGRNGAGKSTLLSLLLADNPQAYANQVRLFGQQRGTGDSIWEVKARIGWMAPELLVHYPAGWRCLEVVLSGFHSSLGLYRPCSAEQTERGRQVLASLQMDALAERPLCSLSQGQQRLVLLARALVGNPELVILDEPCQGLDATFTARVGGAVDRVAQDGRASIIYVTHHEEELPSCITHVLRLEAGRAYASAWTIGRPLRSD